MKRLFMMLIVAILLCGSQANAQMFQICEKVHKQNDKVHNYTIYLDSRILDPARYRDLFFLLDTARREDTITLKINCMGGQVDTTVQIMESIRRCKAKVIADVMYAMSAGAMIAFSCDEIRVAKYAVVLIHNMNTQATGSITVAKDRLDWVEKLNAEAIREIFKGFLTPNEMWDVLKNGKQFYIVGKEVKERLEKMKKERSK